MVLFDALEQMLFNKLIQIAPLQGAVSASIF
jgi:hypothetical protein